MSVRGGPGTKVVFSDVDGTLVHYDHDDNEADADGVWTLPPSSTGKVGVISEETLRRCAELRSRGVRLVLISGMRTPTLRSRLPYLPRADAYCAENGGRIFYPTTHDDDELVEDPAWRSRLTATAGPHGYDDDAAAYAPSLPDRTGPLWEFAADLVGRGWSLDYQGYATCFRLHRHRQPPGVDFDALSVPQGLAKSVNLGCVDVYPADSGKKRCCEYLAAKFLGDQEEEDHHHHHLLSSSCVCLCDDDNDVEMALACRHAYVPSVTSDSMERTVRRHADRMTVTCGDGTTGMDATERALELVLRTLR